jgi:hypothetical protein
MIPPIRNVSEIVVSTLMPMSRAASGSWAVARIARPRRLWLMKVVSSSTRGMVAAIASTSPRAIEMPPMLNSSFWASIRSGIPSGEPPIQRMPTFWRMKLKPIAVISGASLGALRNGR